MNRRTNLTSSGSQVRAEATGDPRNSERRWAEQWKRMPDVICDIRKTCNGMLGLEVYREIYAAVGGMPTGDILEIGTAYGAATVTMGLALRASRRPAHIYT